jgi:hypothetical protein
MMMTMMPRPLSFLSILSPPLLLLLLLHVRFLSGSAPSLDLVGAHFLGRLVDPCHRLEER